MGFFEIRSNVKWLNPPDPRRTACVRARPECVSLPVAQGVTPSAKPPVRIFLGTEPGQYRAERVFVYSIERHRDPARVYEVHLMKDLAGFDRRGWTTGFTNYRFAVPHLAGARGRAIFNDVDEAYFGDPADLFDTDMSGHGYLATSDSETSVMLIDCERMAPIWPLERCRHELKKSLLARTLAHHPRIRGNLPPEWTARDDDFQPGFSKLQHWTTLHTQPWRPVPGRFVYQPNSTGHLWFELEGSADLAGYQVFDRSRPSSSYIEMRARRGELVQADSEPCVDAGCPDERLAAVAARFEAKTLLDYRLVPGTRDLAARRKDAARSIETSRFDLLTSDAAPAVLDGVVCEDVLEHLPDEDAPWIVGELFSHAERFVYAVVRNRFSRSSGARSASGSGGARSGSDTGSRSAADSDPASVNGAAKSGARFARSLSWYLRQFESASRSRPTVHWTLLFVECDARGHETVSLRSGGRAAGGSPRVWVLTEPGPESAREALALASALGWPFEHKVLRFGATGRRAVSFPTPPWPDVVISAGERCAGAARRIRERDQGRTRLVHVGVRGGEAADEFDAVVTPRSARLWPHPNRIETFAALVPAAQPTACNGNGVEDLFGDRPKPHVLLLRRAGSTGATPEVLRMDENVRRFAEQAGGSFQVLHADGSARAGELVARADAVVVGDDDPWLVSKALSSSAPVYVYPVGNEHTRAAALLLAWIDRRAHTRPANRRGTPRPQQGLEYLCARLIERGIVRPPADPSATNTELYLRGLALPFGAPLRLGARKPLREASEVAAQVRERLGLGG